MKKVLLILGISILLNPLIGQTNNHWFFGSHAGLDFSSGTAIVEQGGELVTNEGCASISDQNGDLMFYTDGTIVYKKDHTVMATGLMGNSSSTSSAIIVPQPGSTLKYYIFTVDFMNGSNGIKYSIVDMDDNNSGAYEPLQDDGSIALADKNQSLPYSGPDSPTGEKICAIKKANGDFWIIGTQWYTNNYFVFELSNSGLTYINTYAIGIANVPHGYLKASRDGKKLAVANVQINPHKSNVQLFDFNNSTGEISNAREVSGINNLNYGQGRGCYGVEFSPNSELLYYSALASANGTSYNNEIFQVDLLSSNLTRISIESNNNTEYFGALQLSPENPPNILLAKKNASYLGVINNPNIGGANNFTLNGILLDSTMEVILGLPTFITETDSTIIDSSDCSLHPAFQDFISIYGTTINTDKVLNGKYFISQDVKITNGAILDVTNCDLVFDACVKMTFENNSKIRANNSVFRTCDPEMSWKGIFFNGSYQNIVNECTFKNAETALNLFANSTAKVNSSMFLNNHVGIKFEEVISNPYALTNNNFVLDSDIPAFNCTVIENDNYGIMIVSSNMNGNMGQNHFINNSLFSENRNIGVGIFNNCLINVSENTFTDMVHSIEVTNSISGNIIIENNEMEVNKIIENIEAQILVQNSRVHVNITGNEIRTTSQDLNYAIYINTSNAVNVEYNEIFGFPIAINSFRSNYININNNLIVNSENQGVKIEKGNKVYLGCNQMNLNGNSTGIYIKDNFDFKIISNCINDTKVAIYLQAPSPSPWFPNPLLQAEIRNNSLYNYGKYGIVNRNYKKLYIGTNLLKGQNTFISNSNLAVDINVNIITYAYDNYYVYNISGPLNVLGSNDVFSTASCAHQISQNNYQYNNSSILSCDIEFGIDSPSPVNFSNEILENVNSQIASYLNLQNQNKVILAGDYVLGLLSNSNVSQNEKELFQFETANYEGNYQQAYNHLQNVVPNTPAFEDYKYMAMLQVQDKLSMIDIKSLPQSDIEELVRIAHEDHSYDNIASGILITNYNKEVIKVKAFKSEIIEIEDGRTISLENNFLTLYPNPAKDVLTISYNIAEQGDKEIVIYDITGKIVLSKNVKFVSSSTNLDVSMLSKGIYNVRIKGSIGKQLVQKFIKM